MHDALRDKATGRSLTCCWRFGQHARRGVVDDLQGFLHAIDVSSKTEYADSQDIHSVQCRGGHHDVAY